MSWRFTADVGEYDTAVRGLLTAQPVEHTLPLTVIANARAAASSPDEPALYGWWADAPGCVTGAVSHTPPYELLVAVVPDEAMSPLVSALLTRRPDLPGVHAETARAGHFAALWRAASGATVVLRHAERLYRVDRLTPPDPLPAGRARPAGPADRELLVSWMRGFSQDAGVPAADPAWVDDRMGYGGLTLWRDGRGVAVSFAGVSREAAGVVRLGPVYTPPEHRRLGYGAAVTAAVTRAALARGATEVVLFADLANPTSNHLYQALGYERVSDRLSLSFQPGAGLSGR